MVMDLKKLREDKEYKASLTELKLSLLLRKYSYHPETKLPTLGEHFWQKKIETKSPSEMYCMKVACALHGNDHLTEFH